LVKSVCILVVDDHEASLKAVARLLRINGYTVFTARTAQEARDLAAERRCGLFIGDVGLPDGCGLDLMRELRASYPMKGIAVSGYAERQDVKDAIAAGFDRHIAKPIMYADLLAAVEDLAPYRPPHPKADHAVPPVQNQKGFRCRD
jgi:CheY-like chemotaxis protein